VPMLFGSNDVCRCRMRASDGELGNVCDLFFDERTWTIQHVVVSTGGWPPGKRVLVPRELLGRPDWTRAELEIPVLRRDLEEDSLMQIPIPRTYRAKLRCRPSFVWAYGPGGLARRMIDVLPEHLRSVREINGYRVEARDGRCGVVEGVLFESEDWTLRHVVVGLGWLPAAHALVPPTSITSVDEPDETVFVALERDAIERARRIEATDLRLPSGAQLLVVRDGEPRTPSDSYGLSSAIVES
jgi:hypothetical protein